MVSKETPAEHLDRGDVGGADERRVDEVFPLVVGDYADPLPPLHRSYGKYGVTVIIIHESTGDIDAVRRVLKEGGGAVALRRWILHLRILVRRGKRSTLTGSQVSRSSS